MDNISAKFNLTDALLLYAVAYCQRHNEKATLGGILLTTDEINRSYPKAHELEDGFNRLIAGSFIEFHEDIFTATQSGLRLFNEVTKPQVPKRSVSEQIRVLADKLDKAPIKHVVKQLTITENDVVQAIQEARIIFAEISKKADEILKARKAKEAS